MTHASPSHPRLSRRLQWALLATLVAVIVAAVITAAITAYLEASEIQDDTLLSVARLVESNQIRAATDTELFEDRDFDDSAIRVWQIGKRHRLSLDVKIPKQTGFHTLHRDGDFWRLYLTRKNVSGEQYIVAQQLGVSAELAFKSAKNTALPLLFLLLVIPVLITLIVRHSFKPLNAIARSLEASRSLEIDVTDRHSIPTEIMPFVSAIDRLLEKNTMYNQRQRRFIADAAHEMRTPITALTLQVENVQAAPDEKTRSARIAGVIDSIRRLQRLVSQLLDLARAQSGIDANITRVSLNDLVKNQIAELYPLAEKKSIQLSVTHNDSVTLLDNHHQLQHLVRNALSNALKFAPETGEVTLSIQHELDEGVFRVTDNGPGVSPEQLESLHQPFYRPDDQASGSGAGLGLAICHEIAEQLGGRIRLQNRQPTGFEFCYRQPLAR